MASRSSQRRQQIGQQRQPTPFLPAMQGIDDTVTVTLSVDSEALSEPAREQLARCVNRFADEMVLEAARIEAGERATGVDKPEITGTMVLKAEKSLRSDPAAIVPIASKGINVGLAVASGLAAAFGIAAGVMGTYLHSWWQSTVFGVCLLGAGLCTALGVKKGRA